MKIELYIPEDYQSDVDWFYIVSQKKHVHKNIESFLKSSLEFLNQNLSEDFKIECDFKFEEFIESNLESLKSNERIVGRLHEFDGFKVTSKDKIVRHYKQFPSAIYLIEQSEHYMLFYWESSA